MLTNFMILAALFGVASVLVALIALSKRLDKAERRHRHEVDCLVRSIQMLEQQNNILKQHMNGIVIAGQRLAHEVDRVSRQNTQTVAEGEATVPPRRLH